MRGFEQMKEVLTLQEVADKAHDIILRDIEIAMLEAVVNQEGTRKFTDEEIIAALKRKIEILEPAK